MNALRHRRNQRAGEIAINVVTMLLCRRATTRLAPRFSGQLRRLSASSTPGQYTTSDVAERVAQRVAERKEWPTWKEPTLAGILKFGSMPDPPLPSAAELDVEFPVKPPDFERLANPPVGEIQLTWFGHATVLCQFNGVNIIADPVFSDRCSPFQWSGPRRFRQPPCSLNDLKQHGIPIDVCLISHNHYDHLDYNSVRDLARDFDPHFVVPLGLRRWFESRLLALYPAGGGFMHGRGHKISEVDWWDEVATIPMPVQPAPAAERDADNNGGEESQPQPKLDEPRYMPLKFTAVPMQHWSNRLGWDIDKTLWCGYVVESTTTTTTTTSDSNSSSSVRPQRFLFTGDTGWFDGLKLMPERFPGGFEWAAIPIGAYTPRDFLRPQHMNPEEGVRMYQAVGAEKAMPIHWGTFMLTKEDVLEPRKQLIVRHVVVCVCVCVLRES